MNTFLFFRYGNQMLIFFLIYSKSTNIENRVQIRPILYFSQPIRLQIFFRVSDNTWYKSQYSFSQTFELKNLSSYGLATTQWLERIHLIYHPRKVLVNKKYIIRWLITDTLKFKTVQLENNFGLLPEWSCKMAGMLIVHDSATKIWNEDKQFRGVFFLWPFQDARNQRN